MERTRVQGRLTWRVGSGLTAVALVLAAACGHDEATEPVSEAGAPTTPSAGSSAQANPGGGDPSTDAGAGTAGSATVIPGVGGSLGGSAGSAGSGGSGGTATAGAAALGGSPPLLPGIGIGPIGRVCDGPNDCAPGLACITANHRLLGGTAPPHGFCSAPCTDDQQCEQRTPGAMCFPFAADARYCVEGCSFGAPEIGEAKCHRRDDFSCSPALLGPTASPCSTSDECLSGELCIDGKCNVVYPACLPSCRGDLDCAPGLYCDQTFLTGTCTPTKPTGKRLGEPCTVPSAEEPAEPDGCLGFCQADVAGSQQGHCSATCGLFRQCAWDPTSKKFDGLCLYGSALTAEVGDEGDFGFCTPTCNCSGECSDASLGCSLLDQGPIDETQFRGPGLCFAHDASTVEIECAAGGAGP